MSDQETEFHSGYVAILGKPNAGKSTLMNALVGQRVAIVSDKPQTTRDSIAGILTSETSQVIFLDNPGIIDPKDRFNEALMARVAESLDSADVVYHLVDAIDKDPLIEQISNLLKKRRKSARFLVINKIDKLRGSSRHPIPKGLDPTLYDEVFMISAVARKGLDTLLASTVARLPVGPMYFDPEQISDRDERFIAAEIVREKVFRRTGAEIPYSVFCEVDAFEEKPEKDYIRVTIHVERDSQKGIVIGENGRTLKQIGQDARRDIEKITGRPSFLELWVKVRKNWRKNEHDLAHFGFKPPKKKRH